MKYPLAHRAANLALAFVLTACVPVCGRAQSTAPLGRDAPWSAAEMMSVAAALDSTLEADPASLPRRAGPDGGAAFARLTDPAHVDQFARGGLPLSERLRRFGALTRAYGGVLSAYGRAHTLTGGYAPEVADLLGAGLHLHASALTAVTAAIGSPGADTARVGPALRGAREGALQFALLAVAVVGAPSELDAGARGRLADRLAEEASAFGSGLDAAQAGRLAEVARVVADQSGDPGLTEQLRRVVTLLTGHSGRDE